MKVFYCFLLITFMMIGGGLLYSQPLPIVQPKQSLEGFETARSLVENKAYPDALKIFQELLKGDPDNSNLNFWVGECMMNISGSEQYALPFMQNAVKNVDADYVNTPQQRKSPVFAFEKLGDLCYQDYNFDQAVFNYRSFKAYLDAKKDKAVMDRVNEKLERASKAKLMVNNPLKLTLTELPFINVLSFNDFGAKMSFDGSTVYFSRKRVSVLGNPGNSDIYYMRKVEGKWNRPVRIPFINTDANDDFCWISDDENQMIFASNRDGKYHLYFTERKGKSQWSLPEQFQDQINSKSEEYFGCTSADGKVLYFVSDRKGGFGGKDIYRSFKNPDNDWGPAENLGPKINTEFDENTPFLSRDGKILYFSSTAYLAMGGYDVFMVTALTSTSWTDPVNAGYPINTIGDDLYFNKSYQGKPEYFVSRSKTDKNDFSVSVLNNSVTPAALSDTKIKENPREKTKLKLVPKTLKY